MTPISIENLLIWAFRDERASLHDADFRDVTAGYPQDSIVRAQQADVMGGFIQGTAPGAQVVSDGTADDAHQVAAMVSALPAASKRLVSQHAKAGTRPDWRPHARHRFEPTGRRGEDGAVVPEKCYHEHAWRDQEGSRSFLVWSPSKRKMVRQPVTWCPLQEMDIPAVVAGHRRSYGHWVDALGHLLGRRWDLNKWTLTGEMPERSPWVMKEAA